MWCACLVCRARLHHAGIVPCAGLAAGCASFIAQLPGPLATICHVQAYFCCHLAVPTRLPKLQSPSAVFCHVQGLFCRIWNCCAVVIIFLLVFYLPILIAYFNEPEQWWVLWLSLSLDCLAFQSRYWSLLCQACSSCVNRSCSASQSRCCFGPALLGCEQNDVHCALLLIPERSARASPAWQILCVQHLPSTAVLSEVLLPAFDWVHL